MTGLTLDAGALIGLERGARAAVMIVKGAADRGEPLAVPAGALAQAWRRGAKQARLARFLKLAVVEIVVLDGFVARAAGQLCGYAGTDDVIDASVVLCARARGQGVVTSDPEDLLRIDPGLRLVTL